MTTWPGGRQRGRRAGLTVRCNPVASSHFPTPARRPGYAALENAALNDAGRNRARDWRENVIASLVEQGHRDRA